MPPLGSQVRELRAGKVRLILADDHRLVRETLAKALEGWYTIVAMVPDGNELLRVLEVQAADCVVLDLEMPGQHGLRLLPKIRDLHPELPVVILTMHTDHLIACKAFSAGANGFVQKDSGIDELAFAIGEVCAGRRFVSKGLSNARNRVGLEALHSGLSRLTPRQQEILLLMGEGKSATAIAETLHVAQSTITFHKKNIVETLGMASHEALVQYAVLVRHGTVGTGES